MNIVISMEGVLRKATGELITDGLILFKAMKAVGRVVVLTEMPRDMAEGWMAMNHLDDFDDLIDVTAGVDPAENLRIRQIHHARSRGRVDYYIDADPRMIEEALRLGVCSLMFVSPEYRRPEFMPDAGNGIRPWDDIVAETTRQMAMKAAGKQRASEDSGQFE